MSSRLVRGAKFITPFRSLRFWAKRFANEKRNLQVELFCVSSASESSQQRSSSQTKIFSILEFDIFSRAPSLVSAVAVGCLVCEENEFFFAKQPGHASSVHCLQEVPDKAGNYIDIYRNGISSEWEECHVCGEQTKWAEADIGDLYFVPVLSNSHKIWQKSADFDGGLVWQSKHTHTQGMTDQFWVNMVVKPFGCLFARSKRDYHKTTESSRLTETFFFKTAVCFAGDGISFLLRWPRTWGWFTNLTFVSHFVYFFKNIVLSRSWILVDYWLTGQPALLRQLCHSRRNTQVYFYWQTRRKVKSWKLISLQTLVFCEMRELSGSRIFSSFILTCQRVISSFHGRVQPFTLQQSRTPRPFDEIFKFHCDINVIDNCKSCIHISWCRFT